MILANLVSLESLLLLFFIVTYFISITEKLADWKKTIQYYNNHFKESIIETHVNKLVVFVVILESIALLLLLLGFGILLFSNLLQIAVVGLTFSSFILLVLLLGQRLAKDYAGATSITVYFILNILAIYFLT